ncbi:MAG: hypothetical protein E7211_21165 [Clostridium lundense]|nr:hypothetical protein [Clostridium lundense]
MKYLFPDQIENLTMRLECAAEAVQAIFVSMSSSGSSAMDYAPAVYAAYDHLDGLTGELRRMLEAAQKEAQA